MKRVSLISLIAGLLCLSLLPGCGRKSKTTPMASREVASTPVQTPMSASSPTQPERKAQTSPATPTPPVAVRTSVPPVHPVGMARPSSLYESVVTGMSYDQVKALLGGEGTKTGVERMCRWEDGGMVILLVFRDDRVVSRSVINKPGGGPSNMKARCDRIANGATFQQAVKTMGKQPPPSPSVHIYEWKEIGGTIEVRFTDGKAAGKSWSSG